MPTDKRLAELNRAIDLLGGKSGFAAALSVSLPTVYEWAKGDIPVTIERAVQIEQATGGKVRAESLVAKEPRRPSLTAPSPSEAIEYLRNSGAEV